MRTRLAKKRKIDDHIKDWSKHKILEKYIIHDKKPIVVEEKIE